MKPPKAPPFERAAACIAESETQAATTRPLGPASATGVLAFAPGCEACVSTLQSGMPGGSSAYRTWLSVVVGPQRRHAAVGAHGDRGLRSRCPGAGRRSTGRWRVNAPPGARSLTSTSGLRNGVGARPHDGDVPAVADAARRPVIEPAPLPVNEIAAAAPKLPLAPRPTAARTLRSVMTSRCRSTVATAVPLRPTASSGELPASRSGCSAARRHRRARRPRDDRERPADPVHDRGVAGPVDADAGAFVSTPVVPGTVVAALNPRPAAAARPGAPSCRCSAPLRPRRDRGAVGAERDPSGRRCGRRLRPEVDRRQPRRARRPRERRGGGRRR